MDDQLDNDLKNRIKEVFDNFEDASADEGWLLLREKFPGESKRRGFAWIGWGSAAAVLLMFLGIGLWIGNKADRPKKNIIVKTAPAHKYENSVANKAITVASDNNVPVAEKDAGKTSAANGYQAVVTHPVKSEGNAVAQNSVNLMHVLSPLTDTNRHNRYIAKNLTDSSKIPATKTATDANTLPQLAANEVTKSEAVKPVVVQEKKKERSIIAMFNEDKDANTSKSETGQSSKRVRFGVYAATYFNYSKGSDNQVNVGAGFTSDIKLNKNLKLVTGIAIAQNSLSYQGFPSVVASEKSNLFAATAVQPTSFNALSTPTVRNYNASLVGLDIPINLKYEFNPEKSDMYVSAGLSSGTFIDESYSYKYNYPSLLSPTLQQPNNETTGKNFNSFYFGKTLNVAFGVGYPFGKNRIILEPFLKYPLDGMGSQNLRFGAGGVNLKLNFQSSRR